MDEWEGDDPKQRVARYIRERREALGNPRLYDSWHHRDDPQEPRTLCVVWMVS